MPPGKNAASKTFLPAEWYSLKKFKEPSESSKTVASLFFSVASSFLIVSCNKHLISDLGFEQATTLTGLHTAACVGFTRVAKSLGWVTNKPCPWRAILTFGITQGVSIGFLNLSLGFNSVGFYQMTKLAIIPCTVFLERVVYNKKFSQGVLVSIVILVMGVGVATVTDVELNAKGSALSVLAVVTTCLAQIWTGTMQKRYGLSSGQLLYHASPSMALTLCLSGPLLDYLLTGSSVLSYAYTPASLLFIAVSCMTAVAVNLATFLVIGRCDAITYQVLGHVKTVLILGYGFFRLQSAPSARNVLGVLIALAGVVSYGVCKEMERGPGLPRVAPRQERKPGPGKSM